MGLMNSDYACVALTAASVQKQHSCYSSVTKAKQTQPHSSKLSRLHAMTRSVSVVSQQQKRKHSDYLLSKHPTAEQLTAIQLSRNPMSYQIHFPTVETKRSLMNLRSAKAQRGSRSALSHWQGARVGQGTGGHIASVSGLNMPVDVKVGHT
jgi:hypothetical protein